MKRWCFIFLLIMFISFSAFCDIYETTNGTKYSINISKTYYPENGSVYLYLAPVDFLGGSICLLKPMIGNNGYLTDYNVTIIEDDGKSSTIRFFLDEEDSLWRPNDENAAYSRFEALIRNNKRLFLLFSDTESKTVLFIASIDCESIISDLDQIIVLNSNSSSKKDNYSIGDVGPAGGYIFYDKGYFSDGWRYLEAAPSYVIKTNSGTYKIHEGESWSSYDKESFYFGLYRKDLRSPNLYVNGTEKYSTVNCTTSGIGAGWENTKLLAEAMGLKGYLSGKSETTSEFAVSICKQLSWGGYSDWYLPSSDEAAAIRSELTEYGIGEYTIEFWTSTESSGNAEYVEVAKDSVFRWGGIGSEKRSDVSHIIPIRRF